MTDAINISGVTKTYGQHTAVENLDLIVPRGSIFGFIGPNGSGKTTTIRMIMRIIQPERGTITVLGQASGDAADDRIGYLPEERGLYRKMKARDILQFFGELKGGKNLGARIDAWLDRLELADWADKPLENFSKGMAQKIQFIAAVISEPEVVILDEPFSGLDPINAETLRREVLRLRDEGKTVILSTHDMAVAENLCDFIFMIHKGRKVLEGSIADIKKQHATNSVYLTSDAGEDQLKALPMVREVSKRASEWQLTLDPESSPQELLQTASSKFAIQKFTTGGTSLREIFLAKAGFEA